MQTTPSSFADLSDHDLVATIKRLAQRERTATADLIAALAEMDARRLYLAAGCSSLFTYCTQVLHLSEHAAYGRIEAARAARRFPCILDMLGSGDVTLTTVGLLAPHLTTENHRTLLAAARHKTKREVECQVAARCPRPDAPASIRKIPTTMAMATATAPPTAAMNERASSPAVAMPTTSTHTDREVALRHDPPPPPPVVRVSPQRRSIVEPLAPERYKVEVTLSAEAIAKLRRAQDLLRHTIPDGDPAAIFDRALTLLLTHLERTKIALTDTPRAGRLTPVRSGSRHIPSAVRRAVWARDGGRCAFIGSEGRCSERGFLEFHHLVPCAAGGPATVETIALRCRRHNGYEAELEFGCDASRPEERRSVTSQDSVQTE